MPDWLYEKFDTVKDKPEDARKLAEELLIRQCEDLTANGVDHIHFYTLNKADITVQTCKTLWPVTKKIAV